MTIPKPRRPGPVVALVAIVAVGIGLLVMAALRDTVVYYRTPTEVSQASSERTVRLGGQVVPGTVMRDGDATQFRLTDGHTSLLVIARGALPDTFREGQGAVVEGALAPDGTFFAHQVAVKHSNEYRPPGQGTASGPDG
jgi:cytochrome c-type biogenesis protein CcmE